MQNKTKQQLPDQHSWMLHIPGRWRKLKPAFYWPHKKHWSQKQSSTAASPGWWCIRNQEETINLCSSQCKSPQHKEQLTCAKKKKNNQQPDKTQTTALLSQMLLLVSPHSVPHLLGGVPCQMVPDEYGDWYQSHASKHMYTTNSCIHLSSRKINQLLKK